MLGSVVCLQVAVQKFNYLVLRDLRTPTIEIVVEAVIGPRKINVTDLPPTGVTQIVSET